MSTLSTLVKFKFDLLNTAEQFKLSHAINDKIYTIDKLNIRNDQIDYVNEFNPLVEYYQSLQLCDQEIARLVDLVTEKIDRDIEQFVQETFTSDEYNQKFSHSSDLVNQSITGNIPLDANAKSQVESRITHFGDWHYPGLMIGCRSIEWTNCLVATDPLYLTNYNESNINNILVNEYSEIYQRRLRVYAISNNDYSILPQEQFGLIVGWDYFNYLNLKEIEKIIIEAFKLLKPGGSFIFSYNNCDLIPAAELAENGTMSYCSAYKIKYLAELHGFEILALSDTPIENDFYKIISWAELRKPGELKTIKLNQVMGAIGQK
jgi:hypothetical protein